MEQLQRNVRAPQPAVVEELINAIRTSHDEVDAWIVTTRQAFPVIQDRGAADAD
ncbi:hypothetical protein [Streptomyces chattanoogensis]|uniref:hypothetical protein n=1 Tax=Streptomyces chattanoogensis TaxID=66876 RepID=UPI00368CD356